MYRPLATTAIAGAMLFVGATSASAEQLQFEYGNTSRQGSAGTGTVTGDGTTDQATGAMSANSSATGGDLLPLRILPLRLTSSSTTRSFVGSETIDVTPGDYQVTLTFDGAAADEATAGNGGTTTRATALLAYDDFDDPNQSHAQPLVIDAAELPDEPGTVVLDNVIHITSDGTLRAEADITAISTASGAGNSASVEASVDATSVEITRLD